MRRGGRSPAGDEGQASAPLRGVLPTPGRQATGTTSRSGCDSIDFGLHTQQASVSLAVGVWPAGRLRPNALLWSWVMGSWVMGMEPRAPGWPTEGLSSPRPETGGVSGLHPASTRPPLGLHPASTRPPPGLHPASLGLGSRTPRGEELH
ncbi:hypothetical protein NHX12_022601 [Muraenolepis orangiensis]|uniref:Uncharacterized protein n=1 Tax=Muraenolepis orangiensis TaxID=630683 RepID=A0A9Q0ITP3_9TELE|nr:hypothetical protein NHX12_022601 [Muraenolepis orangiensis]